MAKLTNLQIADIQDPLKAIASCQVSKEEFPIVYLAWKWLRKTKEAFNSYNEHYQMLLRAHGEEIFVESQDLDANGKPILIPSNQFRPSLDVRVFEEKVKTIKNDLVEIKECDCFKLSDLETLVTKYGLNPINLVKLNDIIIEDVDE